MAILTCLINTPKGKIQQYEKKWLDLPWQKVRDSVDVKLFEQDGELYVLALRAFGGVTKDSDSDSSLLRGLLPRAGLRVVMESNVTMCGVRMPIAKGSHR